MPSLPDRKLSKAYSFAYFLEKNTPCATSALQNERPAVNILGVGLKLELVVSAWEN